MCNILCRVSTLNNLDFFKSEAGKVTYITLERKRECGSSIKTTIVCPDVQREFDKKYQAKLNESSVELFIASVSAALKVRTAPASSKEEKSVAQMLIDAAYGPATSNPEKHIAFRKLMYNS